MCFTTSIWFPIPYTVRGFNYVCIYLLLQSIDVDTLPPPRGLPHSLFLGLELNSAHHPFRPYRSILSFTLSNTLPPNIMFQCNYAMQPFYLLSPCFRLSRCKRSSRPVALRLNRPRVWWFGVPDSASYLDSTPSSPSLCCPGSPLIPLSGSPLYIIKL